MRRVGGGGGGSSTRSGGELQRGFRFEEEVDLSK